MINIEIFGIVCETWEEAEDRIVRDYCKATGHWDLFIWEEVEK